MPSSKRAHRITSWMQYKGVIQHMILHEKKTLLETKQALKCIGFSVTENQLEYQLKKWNFRKKIPRGQSQVVWQYIGHKIRKRDAQGKASEVVLLGEVVDSAKVCKETNRHQLSALVRFTGAPASPKTPEGMEISVHTPAMLSPGSPSNEDCLLVAHSPLSIQSLWPRNLPWLQFQSKISDLFLFATIPRSLVYSSPFLDVAATGLRETVSVRDLSRLTTEIKSIMPEIHDRENAERAELILGGSTAKALTEHAKLILYKISNNLVDEASWGFVLDLLDQSGIMDTPLSLNQVTDITTQAIAEKLLQVAFRVFHPSRFSNRSPHQTLTKKLATWLISSGVNPDTRIVRGDLGSTPLYVASRHLWLGLVRQLLDAGADPNLTYDEGKAHPPLVGVIMTRNPQSSDEVKENLKFEVIELLLKAGASLHEPFNQPSALMAAVDREDMRAIDILIQHGANMLHEADREMTNPGPYKLSVMGHAAQLRSEEAALTYVQHLLARLQEAYPSASLVDFVTADVIFLASSSGHNRLLRFLHTLGSNIVAAERDGFTALHAAAENGHNETCELLLKLGALVDGPDLLVRPPSPLHLAVLFDKPATVRLLHQHEADIEMPITFSQASEHYMYIFRFGRNRSRGLKLMPDIHLQERYCAPIDTAFRDGERTLSFEYLFRHGAAVSPWSIYPALVSKDVSILRMALEAGSDPNWRTRDGKTLIQHVLSCGEPSKSDASDEERTVPTANVIAALLEAGANLTGGEAQQAMLFGNWDLVELILRYDKRGLAQQHNCVSMLEAACSAGSLQLVHTVLARTNDTYDPGAVCASVVVALKTGTRAILQLVLKSRPAFALTSPLEAFAIGIAGLFDDTELLDLLLSTIREPSCAYFPEDFREWLLFYVNKEFSPGNLKHKILQSWKSLKPWWHANKEYATTASPLLMAVGSERSLYRLLDHGYRPDKLTLSVAVIQGNVGLLQYLMSYPIQNFSSSDLPGPLLAAVVQNREDMVRVLLEAGGPVDDVEASSFFESPRSPLQCAVEQGYLSTIDMLLEAGADVDTPAGRIEGLTALQAAAATGRLGVAKRLIDRGANINAPGALKRGRTALEAAAEHGRIDMVQYLLSEGVLVDNGGRLQYLRAIIYAQREGHLVAASLLKNYRAWTEEDSLLWANLENLSVALDGYTYTEGGILERQVSWDGEGEWRAFENLVATYTGDMQMHTWDGNLDPATCELGFEIDWEVAESMMVNNPWSIWPSLG